MISYDSTKLISYDSTKLTIRASISFIQHMYISLEEICLLLLRSSFGFTGVFSIEFPHLTYDPMKKVSLLMGYCITENACTTNSQFNILFVVWK